MESLPRSLLWLYNWTLHTKVWKFIFILIGTEQEIELSTNIPEKIENLNSNIKEIVTKSFHIISILKTFFLLYM